MKYEGPLYGKIGRRYILLKLHSTDVDKMEKAEYLKTEYLEKRILTLQKQIDALIESQVRRSMMSPMMIIRDETNPLTPYTEEELSNAPQERMNNQFMKGPDK